MSAMRRVQQAGNGLGDTTAEALSSIRPTATDFSLLTVSARARTVQTAVLAFPYRAYLQFRSCWKVIFASLVTALGPVFPALGQETGNTGAGLSSTAAINLAMVFGPITAAMISAIWLIRDKARVEKENGALHGALADASEKLARHKALLSSKDRRIVVWDGEGGPAEILGTLPEEVGAPTRDSEFLLFDLWLRPESVAQLENAITRLRDEAELFDLTIETTKGEILEAEGRVSGGRAFVRFVTLANLRSEIIELQMERDRLIKTFEALQQLFDIISLPVWMRDQSGRLIWVNNAFSDAVEAQSRTETLDLRLELLGSQTRERIRAITSDLKPFHEKVSTVVRGNRTFFEVAEVAGETGSTGLANDISEAEAVRQELARTLRSHAETLDHLQTPVAIFDREQRLQFYNQAFSRLWELDIPFLESNPTNGEFLERLRSAGKLPEPHSWREWKERMLSVYRSVEPQPHHWHLPDGQTLHVFANAHPQGGATWVFEDLTEKVDLESRYNTLLKVQGETIDHLSEGVCVFGADGKIRLSNPAFRALWGITEKEAETGTHIRQVTETCKRSDSDPPKWPFFSSIITSFDDERHTHHGRVELKSGLILDYAIVPLPDALTMITFVNMSDSIKGERALKKMNEALRQADGLKNNFVQHVSYELRSPLTNIIGFADLLKAQLAGELNDRQREYVDYITTSSAVLLTIVNDILDLATVDAGIMRLELSQVHIPTMVSDVVEQISDRLKEGKLDIDVAISPAVDDMKADPQRLKQILFKLLSNAANFAPDGSAIGLSVERDEETIIFSVSDKGPGIPADIIDTVFKRFEADRSSGRRRGAGLGLSIVQSFVNLHGGKVKIESNEGGGTTVRCFLPISGTRLGNAAE